MEGDITMTGVSWSPASANVFTEVTATMTFTDDDVRAVYIDWDDGASNKKSEANYQWKQYTEPQTSIEVKHTYTKADTFNPVIQTMNSKGFFSKYYTSGTAGTIGVNTEVSPSIGDTGIGKIVISDGTATGIMRVENKTVKSGIDNSLFDKEGPKDIKIVIPPLCTDAQLTTIDNVKLEITALVDSSMLSTTDTSTVGGTGKSVQVISYSGSSLDGKTGVDNVDITGGQVSKILKVVYKNPKYVGGSGATDYTSNAAYQYLKAFVVALGDDGYYYPITYVSAGSPVKKAKDSTRYITMDFSQSRAKASNVSLNAFRYDLGKVWFNPDKQWAVSGSARSEYFGDQTKQLVATSELKELSYAYNNIRPDGLNGQTGSNGVYMAFTASGGASWSLDNGESKRVDQFVVDDFGRFNDQYHMIRCSADPNTTDKDGTSNVSSIVSNEPYIFRMTPGIATGANDSMTKIDYDTAANYTADYTAKGVANGSTNMISLSGMNNQSFKNMKGTDRDANEYILLLFPSKTNKLFFNMNNYANRLVDKNLKDDSFSTPWNIGGVSYLCMDNTDESTQNAYWKPVEFEDTTSITMEYRNTGSDTYETQSNSLSQSGYLSFDMPPDWAKTNLSGLCGGVGIDDSATTAGTADITLSGTAITNDLDATDYGKYAEMTLLAASATTLEASLSEDDIGSFKYVFIITDDGGGAGIGENQMYWVAKGAANGYNATDNKLYLHYGASIGGTNVPTKGTSNVVGILRRINIYDIIDGFSKVYISGSSQDVYYPVGANAAWDNTYMVGDTSSGVSEALKNAWDTNELYALKISLSGAASGSIEDDSLYPELWNIFDATEAHTSIVKEVDDSAYCLNSLAITSDISISRGGTYYSAITRKGKVFIARTGDEIGTITFSSTAVGTEGNFDKWSDPAGMYGHLHTIRKAHANTVRVYWDEIQKDGTYVRYWGVILNVDETHGTGGPNALKGYSFNMMVEEVALIDVAGELMTEPFPLGGITNGRDYS